MQHIAAVTFFDASSSAFGPASWFACGGVAGIGVAGQAERRTVFVQDDWLNQCLSTRRTRGFSKPLEGWSMTWLKHAGPASLAGALLTAVHAASSAAPCPGGLVARAAAPADLVCVTPESRQRAAADNARAPLRWMPGPFGAKTCAMGYVWRQAFASDLTCVTPDVRTATLQENANPRGDP